MIPGEVTTAEGEILLNEGRAAITLMVANTGDRPVQVGSHYHFAETNAALDFDREAARGRRLDIAAGTAVRFEPGQRREVKLIEVSGARRVFGFNAKVMGPLVVMLALLALPERGAAEAHLFQPRDCDNAGYTEGAEFTACRAAAFAETDAELNRIWPEALANAENFGVGAELLAAQRAWLAFRDAECAVGERLDAGAPWAAEMLDVCRTELTAERIGHLDRYLNLIHD